MTSQKIEVKPCFVRRVRRLVAHPLPLLPPSSKILTLRLATDLQVLWRCKWPWGSLPSSELLARLPPHKRRVKFWVYHMLYFGYDYFVLFDIISRYKMKSVDIYKKTFKIVYTGVKNLKLFILKYLSSLNDITLILRFIR